MPLAAPKRCPGARGIPCPGQQLIPARWPRCPACQLRWRRLDDAEQNTRRPTYRSQAEIERRRRAVAAHVALYGWVCLGDAVHPAHRTCSLTADHVPSVAEQVARGVLAEVAEAGPLKVACQRRNSQRGGQVAREQERRR
jgi:hypothetical protein